METQTLAALNSPARRDWTDANLETAMCLWEAALELRDRLPALSAAWEADGTVAIRHRIISLVPACEEAWEASRAAGTEQVPYDWEHCPLFLIAHFESATCPSDASELVPSASRIFAIRKGVDGDQVGSVLPGRFDDEQEAERSAAAVRQHGLWARVEPVTE